LFSRKKRKNRGNCGKKGAALEYANHLKSAMIFFNLQLEYIFTVSVPAHCRPPVSTLVPVSGSGVYIELWELWCSHNKLSEDDTDEDAD